MLGRTGVITGTTSACAENTQRLPKNRCWIPNYLRVRGEYLVKFDNGFETRELPPRARRIRLGQWVVFGKKRTTSACAENTRMLPHQLLV